MITPPQLITDLIRLLLLLAPTAAILSLVAAGLILRGEGGPTAIIGGSFARWVLWAIILITLPQLIGWFPGFGVAAPLPGGGIGTGWMSGFASNLARFVQNLIVGRIVPTLAAFFLLRAILETTQGRQPLPSVIAAMFLLAVQTTLSILQGYNSGDSFATATVLDAAWTYLAGTIFPVAAGLAIVGAIWNFVTRRPVLPLVGATLGLLTVSGLWRLLKAMMTTGGA